MGRVSCDDIKTN